MGKQQLLKIMYKTQLLIATASMITISLLFGIQAIFAAPSQPFPNGNPSIPTGPAGPAGPQGNQGSQGPQGQTGSTGAIGPKGANGSVPCNWSGSVWLSHGIDYACAFATGVYVQCNSGRTAAVADYGGCGWWK